jgi:hypothetical protein
LLRCEQWQHRCWGEESVSTDYFSELLSDTPIHTDAVDTEALSRGEGHHLAAEGEVVAVLGVAHDPGPRWTDGDDPEVIQLEGVVPSLLRLRCGHG